MNIKSFYDLEYIIEINEKRLAENLAAYQKVQERVTTIVLIYSAIGVFIVPITKQICGEEKVHWLFTGSFVLCIILLAVSLFFTIKLILPGQIAHLSPPKKYYETIRQNYERSINIGKSERQLAVSRLLSASYIRELEIAVEVNTWFYERKCSFYYRALVLALLSIIPFMVCLGFHLTKKEKKVKIATEKVVN